MPYAIDRAKIRAEMDRIEREHLVPLSARFRELRKRRLSLNARYQQAAKVRDWDRMTRIERALLQVQYSILKIAVEISPHQGSYDHLQGELTGKPQKIAQVA